jgi:hypothetical protein
MVQTGRSYLPAAGHDWSLPLYDPFVKLLGGDAARMTLLGQAALRPGHRVLDVGCGRRGVETDRAPHGQFNRLGVQFGLVGAKLGERISERWTANNFFKSSFGHRAIYPQR